MSFCQIAIQSAMLFYQNHSPLASCPLLTSSEYFILVLVITYLQMVWAVVSELTLDMEVVYTDMASSNTDNNRFVDLHQQHRRLRIHTFVCNSA